MKPGGQKAKGSAYERKVAELFTKHYYSDGDGEFRRVPMSGAWDKKVAPGDIIPLKRSYGESYTFDEQFPFSIECKNHSDIKHFFSGLYSAESDIWLWMEQSSYDASSAKKIPIVVFKLYRTFDVVFLKKEHIRRLEDLFGELKDRYYIIGRCNITDDEAASATGMVFLLFKDFLEWIDWGHFKVQRFIRSYKTVGDDE